MNIRPEAKPGANHRVGRAEQFLLSDVTDGSGSVPCALAGKIALEQEETVMKISVLSMSLVALCCAANPGYALSDDDCATAWAGADAKKAGVLMEADAPRYFGALHFAGKSVDAKGLSHEQFLAYCKDGVFDVTPAAAGAPFKGANSFTEAQAKSRAAAYGYVVTSMTKDADGIWRGTSDKDGKQISVAVDFKGNVVAN